jgi:ABC-type multidrug transport system fused ATPase/permease subunit
MATIQECDRIMVLDQGSIVEFDKPAVLLNKEKGLFLELTKIANET